MAAGLLRTGVKKSLPYGIRLAAARRLGNNGQESPLFGENELGERSPRRRGVSPLPTAARPAPRLTPKAGRPRTGVRHLAPGPHARAPISHNAAGIERLVKAGKTLP